MKKWKKALLILLGIPTSVFVLGEVFLRLFGFGNAVLYSNDEYTGYIMNPNQSCTKFGKTVRTNEYSMRSDPLEDGEYRILVFGDSVLNGGIYTDNEELATTRMEKELRKTIPNARVLNISCGGWGIDNCWGFLQKYGDFGAEMIVLLFSNHDAVGKISEEPVAGTLYFPDRQYPFAWFELLERYILPRCGIYTKKVIDTTNTSTGYEPSKGWYKFYDYCVQNDIPLLIYLHAQKNEVVNFGRYNENGYQIITFAQEHGIPLCMDLEQESAEDFRDWIYLTAEGQHVIYDVLYPQIVNTLVSE